MPSEHSLKGGGNTKSYSITDIYSDPKVNHIYSTQRTETSK